MKKTSKRMVLCVFIPFIVVLAFATSGWAQDKYPSRPITVYVGYSAGGPTDTIARTFMEGVKDILDVPIAVVNKPGAGQAIAMGEIKKAKPDGYTLGVITTSALAQTHLGRVKYDFFNDFTWMANLTNWVIGISVDANSQWKTWQELQDYAKAHPGELKYAATGTGSSAHLCAEDIIHHFGLDIPKITTTGDLKIVAALLGGHIQVASTSYQGFGEYAKSGKTRVLVVFTKDRLPNFPNVPTALELGVNIKVAGPVAVCAPKDMPKDLMNTLTKTFDKAVKDPRFIKFMNDVQHTPIDYRGPAGTVEIWHEYDNWSTTIMKRIGMIK